ALAVQHDHADVFFAGVQQYERGEHDAAAVSFSEYVRTRPGDENGWYNLGLAAYRAGDPGRATAAWLRALRIAPRDTDVRHNLRAADAAAALARVQPIDWLNARERALGAVAGWWLMMLALAAAV